MLPDFATGLQPLSTESINQLYCALAGTGPLQPESGLGGGMILAGDLGGRGRELLIAANIAGAASLAASPDLATQRQAVRDGVVDFLVTSLEEALRILKNEIRKRQTVSVGISLDPRRLTESMIERGVLPDLLPPSDWRSDQVAMEPEQKAYFLTQGAREIVSCIQPLGNFTTWAVDRDFARWMPKIDACAQAAIPASDLARQRWLRLAPRYLGRAAQREHGVVMSLAEVADFRARVAEMQAQFSDSKAQPVTLSING